MNRLRAALAAAAPVALGAHVVATAVDNLPDQHITLARWSPRLAGMPTWRFFGPNPGVDDMHLFVRDVDLPGSQWREIDLAVSRPWWATLWNPGTRGPKTLFDACQQIKRLSVMTGGSYDAVVRSAPYELLVDFVVASSGRTRGTIQFALLSSRPGPETSDVVPVLTSRHITIDLKEGQ
ncbi:hypothetical protein [Flexivirga meconopsidis]|uniref:hypothetical protein n=1 Tax=Flexivirga meconopsidis TaxID=2977121 RepID=UPI002240A322|nr:hypothetical protein [Flexivirga meconopsidis]